LLVILIYGFHLLFSNLDKDLQLAQTQLSKGPRDGTEVEPDVCVIEDDSMVTVRVQIRGVIQRHKLGVVRLSLHVLHLLYAIIIHTII